MKDYIMTFLPVFRLKVATAAPRSALAIAGTCVAALLSTAGSSFGQAPASDPLVAVVNGTEIRESDVRLADRDIGRSLPTQEPDMRREQIIGYLADTIIFAKAAADQNVGDEADLRRRVVFTRNKALMEKLLEVTALKAVTEDTVRKAYEEFVAKAGAEPELHLRALVFKFSDRNDKAAKEAEDKVKTALKRITDGETFAAVASDMSDDPTVKANGGEFGYRTRAEMGKEYAEVAFKLEKGGVSQPIWTQFGWHLIRLEDKRERKPPALDLIRDKVEAFVARQAQLDLVAKLHAEAKIERQDKQNQDKLGQAEKPEQVGK
jgi:parvulin-like peptidyl-prolyl isomerase